MRVSEELENAVGELPPWATVRFGDFAIRGDQGDQGVVVVSRDGVGWIATWYTAAGSKRDRICGCSLQGAFFQARMWLERYRKEATNGE